MSLLDSFDNNKKRCKECGEYFEIDARRSSMPLPSNSLCAKCFKKLVVKFRKQYDKFKEYPNKKVNLINNKYCYSNHKWSKDE
jgi:hypothetical protein